jgi:hypothetical protein
LVMLCRGDLSAIVGPLIMGPGWSQLLDFTRGSSAAVRHPPTPPSVSPPHPNFLLLSPAETAGIAVAQRCVPTMLTWHLAGCLLEA